MRRTLSKLASFLITGCALAQVWQPTLPEKRTRHSMAFDEARGRTVLVGGSDRFALAGTWEFDGDRWRRVAVATEPPSNIGAGFAYDTARTRCVLFGGGTWEYDGFAWTQRTTATVPTVSSVCGMAFDVARARTVLVGVAANSNPAVTQTWDYDGVNWARAVTAFAPPTGTGSSHSNSLAFDRRRNRSVYVAGNPTTSAPPATFEYDGLNWTQVATATPLPLPEPPLVYDTVRQRVVAFGIDGVTRMFDGVTWTTVPAPSGPPGLRLHALAFDTARGRTLLFSGISNLGVVHDTWQFDGTTWAQPAATLLPQPRAGHAMVYDPFRARTILFGGATDPNAFLGWMQHPDDTWEFSDGWTRVATATSPSGRVFAAMAFDTARDRVVLFGGADARFPTSGLSTTFLPRADTWEYDGANWAQIAPAVSPSARMQHCMAFDAARGRTVLFGGGNFTDTWEYDGVTWTQVATLTNPTAQSLPTMVYHAAIARVVLVGGRGSGEAWSYDGVDWTPLAVPPNTVWQGADHFAAYDPLRGRLLLHQNFRFGTSTLTVEFDGVTWSTDPSVWLPGITRGQTAMTFDIARRRAVLFGGFYYDPIDGQGVFDDTFVWSEPATASWTPHGTGCAGGAGVPTLTAPANARPSLGATFTLTLGNASASAGPALFAFGTDLVQWNGAPLPVSLAALGLPACQAWLAPLPGIAQVRAVNGGTATWSLAIPTQPALAGTVLATQAIVLDASAPGGAALSPAAILRVF